MVRYFFCFMIIFGFLFDVHGSLVTPVNIEQMIQEAHRIFMGVVVEIKNEPKTTTRPFPSIVTVFEVKKSYKGIGSAKTIIVRQPKIGAHKNNQPFAGPLFRVNEIDLVFLSDESPMGFSSPIGFEQGVFQVSNTALSLDQAILRNAFNNVGLFENIQYSKLKTLLQKKGLVIGVFPSLSIQKKKESGASFSAKDLEEMISTMGLGNK